MNIILAWVLVVVPYQSGRIDHILGDYAALADCQRIQASIELGYKKLDGRLGVHTECVQVNKISIKVKE